MSVFPSTWNELPLDRFLWNFVFEYFFFFKSVKKIQVSLKSDKTTGTLREDQYTFMIITCSVLLRIKNVSDKSYRAHQNTHFTFNNFFFKSCCLWDNVEKYCRAGQATDDNMVYVPYMLDTKGYKHTHRICNTYCFSTATVVAQMCLYVTLYAHCLSCLTTSNVSPFSNLVLMCCHQSDQTVTMLNRCWYMGIT
jgi:hypothetical protein